MKGINITLPDNQRGAATLVTALILLLAITLVTFSAARVGVTEQRTSTNDMRAKTAQDVANAGVEYGIAYLDKNHGLINVEGSNGWGAGGSSGAPWQPCTNQTALPCGDGSTNIYNAAGPGFPSANWLYYTVPPGKLVQPSGAYSYTVSYLSPCSNPCTNNIPVQDPTIVVIAQATNASDPLGARAISQRVVRSASGLGRIPHAPIMAAGTVDLLGTMDIWGNATGFLQAPPLGTANPVTTTAAASGASNSDITYTDPNNPPPPP